MARCPFAKWDPITGSPGRFTGGPLKVVHHKTQGGSYAGARGAYVKNKSEPHFTVSDVGIWQHTDTANAARALRNASGGVQTNFDGAIQIEVVGYSGQPMRAKAMENLVRLLLWIEETHRIPWAWPAGRPPKTAEDGYGLNNGDRFAELWDTTGGHYGHSQVPENTHWDPAYTDIEWFMLNTGMTAPETPEETDEDMGYIIFWNKGDDDQAEAYVLLPDGKTYKYLGPTLLGDYRKFAKEVPIETPLSDAFLAGLTKVD